MKLSEILLYSHHGELRRLSFALDGLNIITGSSSTGKSALSEIVEYCMGEVHFTFQKARYAIKYLGTESFTSFQENGF
jgi:predicted ATPase